MSRGKSLFCKANMGPFAELLSEKTGRSNAVSSYLFRKPDFAAGFSERMSVEHAGYRLAPVGPLSNSHTADAGGIVASRKIKGERQSHKIQMFRAATFSTNHRPASLE